MGAFEESRQARRHGSPPSAAGHLDVRCPYQHDRDRILYSPEFRRLGQVTQVLSPETNRVAHNRLTHTLEVAQIGRSVAETILHRQWDEVDLIAAAGGLNPVVVESAALSHDIGHPPFGHTTEKILNHLLTKSDSGGFEGNAQSFRVVTSLATHLPKYHGLNLTRATLAAIQKYPWLEGRQPESSKKWGAYNFERPDLTFARQHLPDEWRDIPQIPNTNLRTLEAEIMDWADDVAYAIHDVEDFFKAGNIIPLDRLYTDTAELDRFLQYHIEKKPGSAALDEDTAVRLFQRMSMIERPFHDSRNDRIELRHFSSFLIGRFITAPKLKAAPHLDRKWDLVIDDDVRSQVRVLKSLLNYYVLEAPSLQSVRHGYERLITQLFEILGNIVDQPVEDITVVPEYVKEWVQNDVPADRVVADFIASMSDMQVISYYRRLTGISFGDSFDVIV